MSAENAYFDWLNKQLLHLGVDHEVFGSYIMEIIKSEEMTTNEKIENLRETLASATENDLTGLYEDMCKKWNIEHKKAEAVVEGEKLNIGEKLATIMEKQALTVPKYKKTEFEGELKQAILAQYAEVSDEDDDCKIQASGVTPSAPAALIPQNTNVDAVITAEKEVRERCKADSEKKKAQDKLNKEKQKQQQQERREKERKRTQKGEHHRQ